MRYLGEDNEFLKWCGRRHIDRGYRIEAVALYVAMLHKLIGADYNSEDTWNRAWETVWRLEIENAMQNDRFMKPEEYKQYRNRKMMQALFDGLNLNDME